MPRRPNLFWSVLEWMGWRRKTKPTKRGGVKRPNSGSKKNVKSGESKRKPVGLEAYCRSVASVKDDPWPARVRDLSSGSIGLLLTRRFEPGTLLVIELEKKKQDQSLSHTLVGRVVHATQNSNGGWMLGCTLANKIAEDDLQDLLL
jgi:hypothetical protein